MGSKFVACALAVQEIIWLKRFFEHLSIAENSKDSIILYCDSQAAMTYTKDPKYHNKIKHMDIMYNFVIDLVTSGNN